MDYLAVAAIGGLLGLCELLARYRDEPAKAVVNIAAGAYVLTNMAAAALALHAIILMDLRFGVDGTTPDDLRRLAATRVLVGGLGAMALFRSSIFTFKIGDKDVPLGPGLILQVLLDVTDRQVDRRRAQPRALAITQIMSGIDFDKAKAALPAYCFGLMQNIGRDEQAAISDQIALLENNRITPIIRSYLLGLLVLNLVGERVLRGAIESLGAEIRRADPPPG